MILVDQLPKKKSSNHNSVPVDKHTGWRGFDGTPVTTIDFDSMKECKEFIGMKML